MSMIRAFVVGCLLILPNNYLYSQKESSDKASETFEEAKFNELLKEAKIDEAAKMLDAEIANSPNSDRLFRMNFVLANRQMANNPSAASQRLLDNVNRICEREKITAQLAAELQLAVNMYGSLMARENKLDQSIAITEKSLNKLSAAGDSSAKTTMRSLQTQMARLLNQKGNVNESLNYLTNAFNEVEKGVRAGDDSVREMVAIATAFQSLFRDSKSGEVAEVTNRVEKYFQDVFDSKKYAAADVEAYVNSKMAPISSMVYADPEKGMELFTALKSKVDQLDVLGEEKMKAIRKRLDSILPTLETSLARAKLAGTPAPGYEAVSFVGMEPAQLEDLKGKVVMLDFWAVWCGPCIATFPHLKEWHEKYSDKGFTILGITTDYGYSWDEKNERAVKGNEVSHDEEMEMLKLFRDHHKLKHGFVVLKPKSDYNKSLMVSGIPQAVLIDKKGIIRMIKVGSGERNAHDLENEIQKLLAE